MVIAICILVFALYDTLVKVINSNKAPQNMTTNEVVVAASICFIVARSTGIIF